MRTDDYLAPNGDIMLQKLLTGPLPENWDLSGDGCWDGFVPDRRVHFDQQGFDRLPDGGYTGWRAFAYYPFLGTFWPTNGSTDDVLIRLDTPFREDEQRRLDLPVYRLNLAIVEALIKREDVPIAPGDERELGVDLDKDGAIAEARRVSYDRAPPEGRDDSCPMSTGRGSCGSKARCTWRLGFFQRARSSCTACAISTRGTTGSPWRRA